MQKRSFTLGEIVEVNGVPFEVVRIINQKQLAVVSIEPLPYGFKPREQVIDVTQID